MFIDYKKLREQAKVDQKYQIRSEVTKLYNDDCEQTLGFKDYLKSDTYIREPYISMLNEVLIQDEANHTLKTPLEYYAWLKTKGLEVKIIKKITRAEAKTRSINHLLRTSSIHFGNKDLIVEATNFKTWCNYGYQRIYFQLETDIKAPSSFPKSGYITKQEPVNSFDCIFKVQNRYVVFQRGFIDSHAKHEALQDLAEQLFSKH